MNESAESIGKMISGTNSKDIKEFITKGQEWAKKKIEEGWRFTVMGLLSPEDIKMSGLVFNNSIEEVWDYQKKKKAKKSLGYVSIPTQEYINGDSRLGPLGYKSIGPSKQFLDWFMKKYKTDEYIDKNEQHIEKQEDQGWDGDMENVVF